MAKNSWQDVWTLAAIALWGYILWYSSVKNAQYREMIITGKMYVKGLQRGWFNDYPQDLSDPQWRILREFMVPLIVGMLVHVAISKAASRLGGQSLRIGTYIVSNVGFLYFLHGRFTVWVLLVGLLCYSIGKTFRGSWLNPALTWAICIIVKGTSDYYRGYAAVRMEHFLGGWASFIDSYDGVYAWQTQFNLSMLRYISFNMELYWAVRRQGKGGWCEAEGKEGRGMEVRGTSSADAGKLRGKEQGDGDDKLRRELELEPQVGVETFTLPNFVAYVYYIPLHIAGPISPFNSWCFQVAVAPAKPVISLSQWFLGFLRVGASTLLLELLLHVWYYVSINNNRTWSISYMAIGKAMPGWEVAWGGLFTLQFMYLKFLVIWRFFRLWSRADGVDVTENMGRCVNNNFTFAGFWRQWHSSLNKWIVKYLYIPLGGTRTQMWNMWIVFTFIGLWHDLMWRWLAWAWLNVIFFSIELGIKGLVNKMVFFKRLKEKELLWKFIVALAGSLNIHLLVLANLAIMHGFEGSKQFLLFIFTEDRTKNGTLWVLPWSIAFFWVNNLSMLTIRAREVKTMGGKRF